MVVHHSLRVIENLPTGTVQDLSHNNIFIASEDFEFQGLPILKGSIVKREGSTVWVNIIRTNEVHEDLHESLAQRNGNDPFRSNVCIYVNHGQGGTFVQLETGEKLKDIPAKLDLKLTPLVFQGIEFSSVAYGFDTTNNGLLGLQ